MEVYTCESQNLLKITRFLIRPSIRPLIQINRIYCIQIQNSIVIYNPREKEGFFLLLIEYLEHLLSLFHFVLSFYHVSILKFSQLHFVADSYFPAHNKKHRIKKRNVVFHYF